MAKYLTPKEYKKLSSKDSLGWRPEYVGYKKKKVREYSSCYECGHSEFIGWVEHSYPIGKPLRYRYEKPDMWEYMNYDMSESLKRSMELIYNNLLAGEGGDMVNIPFVSKSAPTKPKTKRKP